MKIKFDKEGFLIDTHLWNREVARLIAKKDGIKLSKIHWIVIDFIRAYYDEYEVFPLIRQITKHVREKSDNPNIGSIELYIAFPHGVLKQGAKFAGLVKPPSCL